MKKFSFLLLIIIFVMAFPNKGQAASEHSNVFLDGKELIFTTDVQIENVNNNIMIPIRVVAENLGFEVIWGQQDHTVTIKENSKLIKLKVDDKKAWVNSQSTILSTAPFAKSNTVFVPIRFVSEQMGIQVNWDNISKKVYLISPTNVEKPAVDELAAINGMDFSNNRLMISLTENVEPKVSVLNSPDRIVVDIPYAQFSDTFGENQQLDIHSQGSFDIIGYSDISKVRYSLFSNTPSTVRVVLDLNYAKSYSLYSEGNTFVVDLNGKDVNPVVPVDDGKNIVVIDAGHGNQDPGALGVTKKKEKDFNLAIALKVKKLMQNEPNIDVVLTRNDDTFLELKERVKIANDLNADVFVSIHANSSGSSAATGSETYYKNQSSIAFAKVMHKYLVEATGLKDRGVKYGNFHVIRETKMAAVLLEAGYLSNKSDEAALFTQSLQNRVAQGIVDGIKEYLEIE
ncbi:N-acetylmuramoyl-L-alanine amidase family protein [Paenibacillus crassostreae]|uniref:N-acetylmuramoyl-L-alanine amidase n=1 Tax=Paenibacillus crassostreae TaxID=1763538 RepID=A0A167DXS1_9BACL|nr:N-acetylmuramoyl-L-alanine amidase family protein [Paenibacillus crassostreae]AOZ94557.1 N-acetylmuramoyl-L-alanine amidase [Paenibacillus crassostreae]OAB74901.1 N-acetylmuramoyl-L-alanine amidase [Paenibacillus crassostreae]